jgi:cytosine permease
MSGDTSGEALAPTESDSKFEALPASLRAALAEPPVPPKRWQDGIAPAFIAVGMSVVFLDRLAVTTLVVGGLGPAIVGAVLAGLLGYWCLYYAPAMWGVRTRRPLSVVATSTFGARGAVILPGLLLGVVYVLWFALTIDYAAQYTLSGLVTCGLLDPKHLAMNRRAGFDVPKPLFLAVAATWSIASAVIGTLAVRLVAAVMSAYIVFPAIALGAAVVWAIPTVSAGPIETMPFDRGGGRALAAMMQFVFAYIACQGLAAADWGAATKTERDVRDGGLVGVMLGFPVLATLALLVVAGSLGRTAPPVVDASAEPLGPGARPAGAPMNPRRAGIPSAPVVPTLREVFSSGIGGRIGALGLLVLALGLLGPACSNPYMFARQFHAAIPSLPRWVWSCLGALATWPLIATAATRNVEAVFAVIGGMTAPAAGAIAADFARSRGAWPGPRRGFNLAGFAAWLVGVTAAFAIARSGDDFVASRYLPSSLAGFVAAFAAYATLASARLEPETIAIPS